MAISTLPNQSPITQEWLKLNFSYDPETGFFANRRLPRIQGRNNPDKPVSLSILGKPYAAHRMAWLYMTGELPPDGYFVDHINGKRGDNRWQNLRLATPSQNSLNRQYRSDKSTGVIFDKKRNNWISTIRINGYSYVIGRYDDKQDAIDMREAARLKFHGTDWLGRDENNEPRQPSEKVLSIAVPDLAGLYLPRMHRKTVEA